MQTPEEIKEAVRKKYAELANGKEEDCGCSTSCCSPTPDSASAAVNISDDYSKLQGYVAEADLGLGCGIPTELVDIQPGQTVVDLGSGAGNDAFVVRASVGETGKVIGVDMTPDMVSKARKNAEKMGYSNVEFRLGEIENLPVETETIDWVVSNCVLNLVPDKHRAFSEMVRILKPQGKFSISDVVLARELPREIQTDSELYCGCIGGAMLRKDYLNLLEQAGFEKIEVVKSKPISVPGVPGDFGIESITVQGIRK